MSNRNNFLILSILLFPLLLAWQGLDITDMGYVISSYQQFFSHPENTWYFSSLWLTGLIGATWNLFFGSFGFIAFKLAYVFAVYVMSFMTYCILRDSFDRMVILVALLLTVMFCSVGLSNWLSYNVLTGLFYIVAVYFLMRGLTEGSNKFLLLAGVAVGLNIFVRFPNIVGVSLLLPILYSAHLQSETFLSAVKGCGMFVLGVLLAVVVVIVLMILMGHWSFYVESLRGLFTFATDSSSPYSSSSLLTRLKSEHIQVFQSTWPLLLLLWLVSKIILRFSLRPVVFMVAVTLVVCFVPSYLHYFSVDRLGDVRSWIWAVIGTTYVILAAMTLDKKSTIRVRVLGLVSLMVLFLAPLGSGNGIRNAVFGLWLALPVALVYFFSLRNAQLRYFDVVQVRFVSYVFVMLLLLFSLNVGYSYTYRDTTSRIDMRYSIDHAMLTAVYTTQERSQSVKEMIDALEGFVQEDEYLLAYDYIPGVNAITRTQPYLYSSWPMIYSVKVLEKYIEKAVRERGGITVVVRPKGSTYNSEWPKKSRGLLNSEDYRLKRKIIMSFLAKNHYVIVWENDYFQILKPF